MNVVDLLRHHVTILIISFTFHSHDPGLLHKQSLLHFLFRLQYNR